MQENTICEYKYRKFRFNSQSLSIMKSINDGSPLAISLSLTNRNITLIVWYEQ